MKFLFHLQIVSLGLLLSGVAHADVTDISTTPLASSSVSVVKPNVMFILDDSGSMAWDYLPDAANFDSGTYGEKSNHCNGMYFDPDVTYKPPVNADGTSFPDATFTDAVPDGYRAPTSGYRGSNNPANLNNSVYYLYSYTGSGKTTKLDFTYSNSRVITSTDFYRECNSDVGHGLGNGRFTRFTVTTSSSAALQKNFANWYSYYRTRILAMKTSAGLAFQSVGDNYRVGYTTHSYTGTNSNNDEFQKIDDFTFAADGTGQKNIWYSKVYGASASGGTPLRSALSKVGRMYAGKLLTGADDPVQYSCQQNFAILATDGYWNGDDGYKVDGSTAVGDQDGASGVLPPYKDAKKKSDTLADVAYYYYQTDLRPAGSTGALGTDVATNNVPGSGDDKQIQQHMTTFTLGLGVKGTLTYPDAYTGILQGTTPWPAPVADTQTAIDDLWHAAVNGRGSYFSAQDPISLVSGLSKALAGVSARTGAAAAAATSNLQPVAGDNFLFLALYRTVKWDGDLQAKTINPTTGAISDTIWSAQTQLDTKVSTTSDTRTIYTFDSGTGTQLKSFTWDSLTATEKAYFQKTCTNSLLSQCPDLTTAQQTAIDGGQSLVSFVRGQTGNEDQTGNDDRLYRDRDHVLGDIVSAQPVYVRASTFSYLDTNYATFVNTIQKNRRAMVYVAANDGMLHAFDASTGTSAGSEQWAYIPPMVMPKLYKLADKNYASKHEYYVDGSPSVGDICPNAPTTTCTASQWKTILVGGLNAGGKGYYALDITDPLNPKALWNYTVADDADMGLSFGNPIITKRSDGTWVVVFTSGYNNTGGDGKGHLYVLNANTGERLLKLDTTAGSSGSPSGLAKISGWVDAPAVDNTVKRFYGGDLLGNVWRFDTDDRIAPSGNEATLLAELGNVSPAGVQPVTVKPLLSEIAANGAFYPLVVIGTGRYLGDTDRADTSIQSVYALKDTLASTGLGQVRSLPNIVKQTLTTNSDLITRTTSTTPVDWSAKAGWYLDLNPDNESPGERVNVDMQQQQGLLTVVGNVPEQNACTIGGYAWLYFFDYRTGQFSPNATNQIAGNRLSNNALVAGINTIKLENGKTVTIVTDTSGNIPPPIANPPPPGGGNGEPRRVSWQELTTD
jgi:type IV pilus assembly protein PilY1